MQDKRGASYRQPARAGRRPAPSVFPVATEEQEQIALAQYLDMKFGECSWFHVPNGGMRNKVVAGKLKAQGAKKGVPDNFIIVRPPHAPEMCGVVIELKRTVGGVTSPEQKKWLKALDGEGWIVHVCKGSGEAIDILERIYGK